MGAVLLVRHAQASFGKVDYDVLSARGERQAAILGERLRHLDVARVVHGGMRRQEHTAEIVLEHLGEVPVRVDPAWGEYDHEAILAAAAPTEDEQAAIEERMAAATDLRRAFQEIFEAAVSRWTAGAHDADYTEPYRGFRQRVRDGLATLLEDGAAGTTVVVTSGGAISAVVADHLGLDADAWRGMNRVLVNTSVTKLVHGRSGVTLLTVNDHAHLESQDLDLLTYR
ncbi:MAG: histidine phosphatase family protein [Actinobacteria bacterium]|nr:histidine phosphatase family protein [Actinomycetota bacterium]